MAGIGEILITLAITSAATAAQAALAPRPKLFPVDKGRFDDIRIQGSEYGTAIPIVYGRMRVAGNIIWSDGVQPRVTTTSGRSGKGGQPPTPPENNYTYTTNMAVGICQGEIFGGLKRIWEDEKIVVNLDADPLPLVDRIEAENDTNTFNDVEIIRDIAASNDYKVKLPNTGSSIQFNNITVLGGQGGDYWIWLVYSSPTARTATWYKNGISQGTINFPSTGSEHSFDYFILQTNLPAGTYDIKIEHDGSPAPFIDALAYGLHDIEIPIPGPDEIYAEYVPLEITGLINTSASYPDEKSTPQGYYNDRPVMDADLRQDGTIGGGGGSTGEGIYANYRFYGGSETQQPDPFMESIDGAGNVPAYRGTCYIFMENYRIPNGRIPNLTFEVESGIHDLADILIDLWDKVGIDSSYIDVSALEGEYVDGLIIQTDTPLKDILDTLMVAYAFDFADIDGKIVAVRRGGTSIVSIPEGDLRAYEQGGDIPIAPLFGGYIDSSDLPKQIDVTYLDRSREYFTNVQPAIKQLGTSEEPETINIPLVLTSDAAQEIGLRALYTIHLQRESKQFSLPPKYLYLTPTDIVTIELENAIHNLRITQYQTGLPGICHGVAVPDSATVYNNVISGSTTDGTEISPIGFPSNTEAYLLDMPPLREQDSESGFYAAACKYPSIGSIVDEGRWTGAVLYQEVINTSNEWSRIGAWTEPCTLGIVPDAVELNTELPDGGGFDDNNIRVKLLYGTLESFTTTEIDDNPSLNVICIGDEYLQFATAIPQTPTFPYSAEYDITKLKRGINGTGGSKSTHVPDDRFVLFNSAVKFIRVPTDILYTTLNYKAVTIGQPIITAPVITFQTGDGNAPPVVSNLMLSQVYEQSVEGISSLTIRATFDFGSFVGGQRAKIFINRPGDTPSVYIDTGTLVYPDPFNSGSCEIPAMTDGTYYIKVVSESTYGHSKTLGHPESSIGIAAPIPAPDTPTGLTASFDGGRVVWTWDLDSDKRIAYWQIADETTALLTDGHRLDTTKYVEQPVASTIRRRVRAVNNAGIASEWTAAEAFNVPAPSDPTGYDITFDGQNIVHRWEQVERLMYRIGDSVPNEIAKVTGGEWVEPSPTPSRNYTRNIKAIRYGVESNWVQDTLSITAPTAPASVTFKSESSTPYSVYVAISDTGTVDKWVISTKLEILNGADDALLATVEYKGTHTSIPLVGKLGSLGAPTIKARVSYSDFVGYGSPTTSSVYTLPQVLNEDLKSESIDARTLLEGTIGDNLVLNGSFEQGNGGSPELPVAWREYDTAGMSWEDTGASNSGKYIELNVNEGITSKIFPVHPGSYLATKMFLANSSAASGQIQIRYLFRESMPTAGDDTDHYIGTGSDGLASTEAFDIPISATEEWSTGGDYWEGEAVVPADKYWCSISIKSLVGTTDIDDVIIKEQVGSFFVGELFANRIVANQGEIGLVFADQIRQSDYEPYITGSSYSPDIGWDYTDGSGLVYDEINGIISYTGNNTTNSTNTVYTDDWQRFKKQTDGYFQFVLEPHDDLTQVDIYGGIVAADDCVPSSQAPGSYQDEMDYYWAIEDGIASVREASTNVFTYGIVEGEEILYVGVEGEYVRFRLNGELVYTSPRKPSISTIAPRNQVNPDFRGMICLASAKGSTVTAEIRTPSLVQKGYGQGWNLNPLSGDQILRQEPIWTDSSSPQSYLRTDLKIGNNIFKDVNAPDDWNASITTEQEIVFGDGKFEGVVAEVNPGFEQMMIGLTSNTNWTDPHYDTIDFAIFFWGGGVYVYESGVSRGLFSSNGMSYDKLSVSIEGGEILYRLNDQLFYTSTIPETLTYPLRGKICINSSGDGFIDTYITASTSGLGEFNSGISVRGKLLTDIVNTVNTSVRDDNRYRGNDREAPSNKVSVLSYDSYNTAFEDDKCWTSLALDISDYKDLNTKNLDSLTAVRVRVYNKFGTRITKFNETHFPTRGRGICYTGYLPRAYSDPKQEAVFSVELENLYGYSQVLWYTTAPWRSTGGRTWVGSKISEDISYSPPQWMSEASCPTNLSGASISSTSVRLTWTNAASFQSSQHDVYARLFRADGYEGTESGGGWGTSVGNSIGGTVDVTELSPNCRYEFMVLVNGEAHTWSNIAYVRTPEAAIITPTYTAPLSFVGNNTIANEITLTWDNNASANYDETEVFYISGEGTPDEGDTQLSSGLTGGTVTHSSLGDSETYSYRARNSYNTGANFSDWTSVVTSTTLPPSDPDTIPTDVMVEGLSTTTVAVSWTANGGATKHWIELDLDGNNFSSPYRTGVQTSGTSIIFTGLLPSRAYIARVSSDVDTKVWTFSSDSEGLADAGLTGNITFSYDAGDSAVKFTTLTPSLISVSENALKVATTDTWLNIGAGLSSGDTITNLCLYSIKKRVLNPNNRVTLSIVQFNIVDNTNTKVYSTGDLFSLSTGTTTDSVYLERTNSTQKAVLAGKQAHSTQVRLRITQTFDTSASSPAGDFRYDDISLGIKYLPNGETITWSSTSPPGSTW